MKKSNLEDMEWKKNWAGKWTLLECCYFGKEYTKLLDDTYGRGPTHSLFSLEDGSSANFLVSDEIERFTQQLVKQVQKKEAVVFELANTITIRADDVLNFVRGFKTKPITKEDFGLLWKYLDAYLLVHFPIKKIVDYLSPDLLQRVLPILEKARVYAEPVYAESLEFVKKFAKDISGDFKLTPELFLCLTNKELDAAFAKKNIPGSKALKERYAFSILMLNHGEVSVLTGSDARTLAAKTIHKISKSDQLKGMGAYPGKVQGRIRIVFHPQEVQNLPPGTVLVTGMTRPDYLHLFRDAVAVVTDAGGVLSHAAITARELGKPTVVGTEISTKILKDGDLVEVDAERGIVKILNKRPRGVPSDERGADKGMVGVIKSK